MFIILAIVRLGRPYLDMLFTIKLRVSRSRGVSLVFFAIGVIIPHARIIATMDTTKQWFNYLHTDRNISVEAISEAGLKIHDSKLEIPIFDAEGVRIFSKFRKEPWAENDLPKYTYEYGSKISLYGIHCKSKSERLFICEGELDQIALRTIGLDSYSSTGGAMSWQKDWVLDRVPTVIYDNDEAGLNGAVRTILMLGEAVFSWVPPAYGKDVGDVLSTKGPDFLSKLLDDPVRQIHINVNDLTTKASIGRKRKHFREMSKGMEQSVGQKFMLLLGKKLMELEKAYTPKKVQNMPIDSTKRDRAKAYPIGNLIKVGTHGSQKNKAICPFHTEKTGSYHVYPNNTGHCYGQCGRTYDVIDIYMMQQNLTFKQAIDELSQKT